MVLSQWPGLSFIPQDPHELLCYWLEELSECGVDLEEYGRTETELFEQGSVSWSDGDRTHDGDRETEAAWRVASLKYGKTVEEWSISVEFGGSSKVTEGEQEAKNPKQTLPGSWVEEEDPSPSDNPSDVSLVDDTSSDNVVADNMYH